MNQLNHIQALSLQPSILHPFHPPTPHRRLFPIELFDLPNSLPLHAQLSERTHTSLVLVITKPKYCFDTTFPSLLLDKCSGSFNGIALPHVFGEQSKSNVGS